MVAVAGTGIQFVLVWSEFAFPPKNISISATSIVCMDL